MRPSATDFVRRVVRHLVKSVPKGKTIYFNCGDLGDAFEIGRAIRAELTPLGLFAFAEQVHAGSMPVADPDSAGGHVDALAYDFKPRPDWVVSIFEVDGKTQVSLAPAKPLKGPTTDTAPPRGERVWVERGP